MMIMIYQIVFKNNYKYNKLWKIECNCNKNRFNKWNKIYKKFKNN